MFENIPNNESKDTAAASWQESEKERKEGLIERYVEKGENDALTMIQRQFEDAPEEKDKLPFHGQDHTKGVAKRTEDILLAIKRSDPLLIADSEVKIGRLAGAFHDVIQRYEENKVADGAFQKTIRKRFAGQNEKESADAAVAFMKKANQESGQEIFTPQNMDTVRQAIDATVPGFNPEKNTVVQPNLTETSSLITRAVALADLGTAGMDGPEAYVAEGAALFREENLDILDAVKDPAGISPEQKEYFRKRMLGWSQFQPRFAQGRKELLDKELQGIPRQAQQEVANLFNKFDQSIAAASETAKKREALSFEELARDMGYEMPESSLD